MNAIDQSLKRMPCHTDWRRYDSPTVLRRHGRGFLERSRRSSQVKPAQPGTAPVIRSGTQGFGGKLRRIVFSIRRRNPAAVCRLPLG